MFTVASITDFADPRLAPYRNLRAQFDHLSGGVFVAEGGKILRRLLESPHKVISVLLPQAEVTTFEPLLARRSEDITLYVADRAVLEQLTGFHIYQGILGLGHVPAPWATDAILALPAPRLVVALDGLNNAENIGAIVRSAAAFGVQALIVGENSAHPYLRRAVRSSMGSIFALPYLVATDLTATLARLRAAGIQCIAAHPSAAGRAVWHADLRGDACIVLGAEGEGLRPEVLAACNVAVAIPMQAGVDSLNVGSAAAVFLAEAARQRVLKSLRP